MSTHSMSSGYPAPAPASERSEPASWLVNRALWGGLSIVAMWLAVLFVGVFGGDINKVNAGGGASSIPVVVVVAVVALLATIAVARPAFGSRRGETDLRDALEEQGRDLERLSAQLEAMRHGRAG